MSEGETSVTRTEATRSKAGVPNFNRETSINGGGSMDVPDTSPKTSITDSTSTSKAEEVARQSSVSPTGGVGRFNVKPVVADDHHSPREVPTATPSQITSPPTSAASGTSTSGTSTFEDKQHLQRTKSPLGRFSVKPVAVSNDAVSGSSTTTTTPPTTVSSRELADDLKQTISSSSSATSQQQQQHQQNMITPQSSFETIDSGTPIPTAAAARAGMSKWASQDASTDTELDAKEEASLSRSQSSSRSSSRLSKHTTNASSNAATNNISDTIQDSPPGSPSLPIRRKQQEGKKAGPRVSSTVLEFDPLIVASVLETLSGAGTSSGSSNTNPVFSTGTQPTAETTQDTRSNAKSSNDIGSDSNNTHNTCGNTYNNMPSDSSPHQSAVEGVGGSGTNSYCSSFNNSRCSSRTGSPTLNVTPSGSLENIKQFASCSSQQSSLMSALKRDETVIKFILVYENFLVKMLFLDFWTFC